MRASHRHHSNKHCNLQVEGFNCFQGYTWPSSLTCLCCPLPTFLTQTHYSMGIQIPRVYWPNTPNRSSFGTLGNGTALVDHYIGDLLRNNLNIGNQLQNSLVAGYLLTLQGFCALTRMKPLPHLGTSFLTPCYPDLSWREMPADTNLWHGFQATAGP